MKNFVLATAVATISLASIVPVFAAEPNGTFVFKDNTTYDQSNTVGKDSSQIIQNGQFVSGNCNCAIDQTTTPGSRAEAVQAIQASEGRGRDK